MTTEDDFQRQLDADPADANTRLVLADWLQERGDERAPGYRALGANGFVPEHHRAGNFYYHDGGKPKPEWMTAYPAEAVLPTDWFAVVTAGQVSQHLRDEDDSSISCNMGKRRSVAEDAAAIAFSKLPATRRAELLAPAEVAP